MPSKITVSNSRLPNYQKLWDPLSRNANCPLMPVIQFHFYIIFSKFLWFIIIVIVLISVNFRYLELFAGCFLLIYCFFVAYLTWLSLIFFQTQSWKPSNILLIKFQVAIFLPSKMRLTFSVSVLTAIWRRKRKTLTVKNSSEITWRLTTDPCRNLTGLQYSLSYYLRT